MELHIELDREDDGRFIAEIPEIPGVMVYGATLEEAVANVKALALVALADQLRHGELAELSNVSFVGGQAA